MGRNSSQQKIGSGIKESRTQSRMQMSTQKENQSVNKPNI